MLSLKLYHFYSLLFCAFFLCRQNHINFKHLSPTLNNKLIAISKTAQDQLGTISMLSAYGVLVYDGYDYKVIKNETIFPNWKEQDSISDIVLDNNKNIWITSTLGLVSKYDVSKRQFEDISILVKDNITKVRPKEESIWLISKNSATYRYFSTGQF